MLTTQGTNPKAIPFSSEEEKNNENGKKMDVDSLWLNNRKKHYYDVSNMRAERVP